MAQVNRRKISLYDEAKAGFKSLPKQTATVFLALFFLLIVTGGSPPAFIMGLCVSIGVGFVAWSEKRRLTELESAEISPNKKAIVQKCLDLYARNLLDSKQLQHLIQQMTKAQTDDFFELAKIPSLDLLKDFVGADLSNTNLSNTNLRGADLSGADLGNTNLSGANLSNADLSNTILNCADLSGAALSDANLSNADLSHAILHRANLYDVNLSHANLNYADMSCAMLYGANLSFAQLDGTMVKGSGFGWNKGLTEDLKRDLQQRGAIFKDSAGDRSQAKTT